MMNRFFTLLFAPLCLTAVGQSEYCLDGTIWDELLHGCIPEVAVCDVEFDFDGDGTVGSFDLLVFLGGFGTSFPDVDDDGICDNIDDCVGYIDECGVCNGPGAITPCGCEGCPEFSECGDVLEYEGQYYETTQIGEQCWFAENLGYLPQVYPPENNSTNEARYYVYGYYGESVDEAQALSWFHDFGVLYNFPAILQDDTCPTEWHVSTLEDWDYILDFYGGEDVAGVYLRVEDWYNSTTGTFGNNESGLSLDRTGMKFEDNFVLSSVAGYWRTPNQTQKNKAWIRYAAVNPDQIASSNLLHTIGMSVRCVRDAE